MKLLIITLIFSTFVTAGIHVRSKNRLWKSHEVTACFAAGEKGIREGRDYVLRVRPWKESHKLLIKTWVLEEFTPERTGIHFTGFEDCEYLPNADLIIFHNKSGALRQQFFGGGLGSAPLGANPGSVEGYPVASGFVSISSNGVEKAVVIHEFGHSAGLAHEHLHPRAIEEEKGCYAVPEEFKKLNYYTYREYDPESVMNYCRLAKRGGYKLGLSAGDVKLLRELYP